MSRAKEKGTAFETQCARYLSRELDEDTIERRALHGAHDMGDLYGIRAHGLEGIAECKSHKRVTPSLVAKWREETLDERDNADADFALLMIHTAGAGEANFGRTRVDVTLRDLSRVGSLGCRGAGSDGLWLTLDASTACALMRGDHLGGAR